MKLHVGCAMWTLGALAGTAAAASAAAARTPRRVRDVCNAVEGNTTFYATPSRATVEMWAAQAPEDFRFLLKLPKPVTHERRLAPEVFAPDGALRASSPRSSRSVAMPRCGSSSRRASVPRTSRRSRRSSAGFRRAIATRSRCAIPPSSADSRAERDLEELLTEADAEWVPFDTTGAVRNPADQRRRARGVDQEAAAAAPYSCPDTLPRRALHRPRRRRTHRRGLAAVGGHHGAVAARRALADGVHPHAGQRRRPVLARRFHEDVRRGCRRWRLWRSRCRWDRRPCSSTRLVAV